MSEYTVSCAQMKILEQNTDAAGLSYYQMMENAGTIAANRIVEITVTSPINDGILGVKTDTISVEENGGVENESPINDVKNRAEMNRYVYMLDRPIRARVYCGKGNNGGDGFVVARLLRQRGWRVDIVLVDGEPTTPDAIANYDLVKKLAIPVWGLTDHEEYVSEEGCDVVIDAIYGTGFHGQLRENGVKAAEQIAAAREAGARVFALDIPSGMGGDLTEEGDLDPRCVRADVTITFHAKKPVHLQKFAAGYCGQIITADIGIVDPDREDAETYTFEDFVWIVSRLRAPDGCPWDRAQDHISLKKYLLEETAEAAEAIDRQDDANLCEELGDVLLQVVLHAQLGSERGAFDIDDVLRGISEKMIRRHPWVFGDMHVETPEEGEKLWEEIKRREKEAEIN